MKKYLSAKIPYKGRTAGRLAAVQALFQIEQNKDAASSVVSEFLTHRIKDTESGVSKFDVTFFKKLVEGAWKDHGQFDEIISGALKTGWTLDRIEPVSRAILRAAIYELHATQTPSAVIIDEYINIAHGFFNETEVSFVNGILNTMSKRVRPSLTE